MCLPWDQPLGRLHLQMPRVRFNAHLPAAASLVGSRQPRWIRMTRSGHRLQRLTRAALDLLAKKVARPCVAVDLEPRAEEPVDRLTGLDAAKELVR